MSEKFEKKACVPNFLTLDTLVIRGIGRGPF